MLLNHAGVKIVSDEIQFFSAPIQGLNTDAFVTRDFASQIGNAQTTFPIVFHFFCQRRDLWIDEYRERNLWFLRITRVLRAQIRFASLQHKRLQRHLAVNQRRHHVPGARFHAVFNNGNVSIHDAFAHHRIASDS